MENGDDKLAEESKRVQQLKGKLKLQLDLIEQQVAQRALKNKSVQLGAVGIREAVLNRVSKTLE